MERNWEEELKALNEYGRLQLYEVYFGMIGEEKTTVNNIEHMIEKKYFSLNRKLICILAEHNFILEDQGKIVMLKKNDKERIEELSCILQNEENNAFFFHYQLLKRIFPFLENILKGKKQATDVLFPEGKAEYVEKIYKDNPLSDYFNEKAGTLAAACVQLLREEKEEGEKIRILEIGSGTGGTSKRVLEAVAPYADEIEYYYTDISQYFLNYGKAHYAGNTFIKFEHLDIEKPVLEQGFSAHTMDIILGANVIHATSDIGKSVQNLKQLMKNNAWFLLNEITSDWEFAVLTFGLLDGWWLSKDISRRITDSPLLTKDLWINVLKESEFKNITFDFLEMPEEKYCQSIILAESTGSIEQISVENHYQSEQKRIEREKKESQSELSKVQEKILDIFQNITCMGRDRLDFDVSIWDYGVDSILISQLANQIECVFQVKLKNSDFFKYTTIRKIVALIEKEAFVGREQEEKEAEKEFQMIESRSEDVAIIGMSGEFAGAKNISEFWNMIEKGTKTDQRGPYKRWGMFRFKGRTVEIKGHFLEDIYEFDPEFFHLSPRQAEQMDPRQRKMLKHCWNAIEDAGYTKEKIRGEKVGVYIGCEGDSGYLEKEFSDEEKVDSHAFLGRSNSILSSRISYYLDLKGPSITIDTACSSSLVSIQLACEAIKDEICDMALCGGVQIIIKKENISVLNNMGMLSKTGECRAFDEAADGFAPGEAAAVVMLKSLDKAIKDQDIIYGVIKGGMVNQDGQSNGITAPNEEAQETLIKETLNKYQILPESISYIEAHGTGTPLGDPMEVRALAKVFSSNGKNRCSIGSVKANIGHCGAAAGVCGLIKLLLTIKYEKIPKQANFCQLNPEIELDEMPFYISESTTEWKCEGKRRGTVSAFGHSGTNAFLVVEEYKKVNIDNTDQKKKYYPFVVTNDNQQNLILQAADLLKSVDERHMTLKDISYTLTQCRTHFKCRVAFAASTIEELSVILEQIIQKDAMEDVSVRYDAESESMKNDIKNFMEGKPVDWSDYYTGEVVEKVSVATYHFQEDCYCNQQSIQEDKYFKLEGHQKDQKSATYQILMSQEDFYFKDHVIRGQKVLPGVAYLEIARKGYEDWSGNKAVHLHQVVFQNPIAYEEGLNVFLELKEVSGRSKFEIFSRTAEKFEKNVQGYIGTKTEEIQKSNTIEELKYKLKKTYTKNWFYESIKELGLDLRQHFQIVENIWTDGEKEVLTELCIKEDTVEELSMIKWHTAVMDGALQGIIALVHMEMKCLCLPYLIEDVTVFGALAGKCYARICRDMGYRGKEDFKFDVTVYNHMGERLIDFRGVLARPYALDKEEKKMKERVGSVCFFKPVYREKQLDDILLKKEEEIIVIYGDETEQEAKKIRKRSPMVKLCKKDDIEKLSGGQQKIRIIVLLPCSAEKEWLEFYYMLFRQYKLFSYQLGIIHLVMEKNGINYKERALNGFFRTAEKEYRSLKTKIIVVKDEFEDTLEEILYGAIGGEKEVLYQNGLRKIRSYCGVKLEAATQIFQEGQTCLITGGLKGTGYELAKLLVHHYGVRLVLLGKSILDRELEERLRLLQETGRKINYYTCDITNEDEVKNIIAELKEKNIYINGMIHCAGVIADGLICNKRDKSYQKVIDTKFSGYRNIEINLDQSELKFCVLFSSLTAVLGNEGQSDYGYANSLIDYYAEYQKESGHGPTVVSIAWPYLETGEMGLRMNQNVLMESGMEAMTEREILAVIVQAVCANEPRLMVWKGELSKFEKFVGNDKTQGRKRQNTTAEQVIKNAVEMVMKIPKERIEMKRKFSDYGFDSITFSQISDCLLEKNQLDISPAKFFEYPYIEGFCNYLQKQIDMGENEGDENPVTWKEFETAQDKETDLYELVTQKKEEVTAVAEDHWKEPKKNTGHDSMAVIGMSGIFPGAQNVDIYWRNIVDKKIAIHEIPQSRWNFKEYFGDSLKEENKSDHIWGGFIDDIDKFDIKFFKISPKEANLMDPQQRLFIQAVWKTIEDAGYRAGQLRGKRIGVFVGVSGFDYSELLQNQNSPVDSYTSTGNSHAMIANKISYLFDFHGPSEAIDTACSSSLAVMHRAVKAVREKECDMAIVGGVNIILSPKVHISFSKAGMLSKSGNLNAFDESADGYIRGEGIGAVMVRPLMDAEENHDHIYALIKGTSENHGGNTNTITSPNPNAQCEVILDACKDAEIDFGTVSYIETHGTGTRLGDTVEANGLVKAFEQAGIIKDENRHCFVGSVKPNIGHLESAAGIAGFIKTVLALQNRIIPGIANFKKLNPLIKFDDTNYTIAENSTEWEQIKENDSIIPRRAGISSFGFGGTNCHVILEEYTGKQKSLPDFDNEEMIILSAKTNEGLREYAQSLLMYLKQNPEKERLEDIAYTLQLGREGFAYRFASIASSKKELEQRLEEFLKGEKKNIYEGNGSGDDWEGMLEEEELKIVVDQLIKKEKKERLLQLWTKGVQIPWSDFHRQAHRVSLPTYPFEKRSCWMKESTRKQKQNNKIGTMIDAVDYQKSMEKEELVFVKELEVTQPILRDHTIDGKCVLPGVGQLECICQAAKAVLGEELFQIKINWLIPVVIESSEKICIKIKKIKNNTVKVKVTSEHNKDVIYSIAEVKVCEKFEHAVTVNVKEIISEASKTVPADEFYEWFRKTSVTHGLYCMSMKELYYIGNEVCVGRFQLPEKLSEEYPDFVLHPTIMDGILQATIGVTEELFNSDKKPKVPYSIEHLKMYQRLPKEGYSIVKKVGKDRFDITVTDINFATVMVIEDMTSRTLQEKNTDSLKCYNKEWVPFSGSDGNPDWGYTLIIYNTKSQKAGRNLAENLKQVEMISVEESDSVFKEIIHNKKERFSTVCFLMLSSKKTLKELAERANYVQSVEMEKLLFFIHALVQENYDTIPLNIKVVTCGSYEWKTQGQDPCGGILQGFTKSLDKEFSVWNVQGIDMDYPNYENMQILAESPRCAGKEILVRKEKYYIPCIKKANLISSNQAFKHNGTYLIAGGAGGIGIELTHYLAKKYNANVILLGRRSPEGELAEILKDFKENGFSVNYFSCDIADKNQIFEVKEKLNQWGMKVDGVIQSAFVLRDRSVRMMISSELQEVLHPKVAGSISLLRAFQYEKLDFMVFFSSFQSFSGGKGQANYAAASVFQDSLAALAENEVSYPVKVVNWGYWGEIGSVAGGEYKRNLKKQGMYSISADKGIQILEEIIKSTEKQVIVLNAEQSIIDDYNDFEQAAENPLKESYKNISSLAQYSMAFLLNNLGFYNHMEMRKRISAERMGQVHAIAKYEKLLEEIRNYYNENLEDICVKAAQVGKNWEKISGELERIADSNEDIRPYSRLMLACLKHYREVLEGRKTATEVIFPDSSQKLVEDIYCNNHIADYYNHIVAKEVRKLLTGREKETLKILEIGAGTGGTTTMILPLIEEFEEYITYFFTDLSRSFLNRAKKKYAANRSFMRYEILDIENLKLHQERYDIIVATNVLHATKSIGNTLKSVNSLLDKKGVIVLNETTEKSPFLTMVFGLLDGWWLYTDREIRISGAPMVSKKSWTKTLENSGMVTLSAEEQLDLGQAVIVAQKRLVAEEPKIQTDHRNLEKESVSIGSEELKKEIRYCIQEVLQMEDELSDEESFADNGIDSISGVEVVAKLNDYMNLSLRSTILFDYNCIKELADYISELQVQTGIFLQKQENGKEDLKEHIALGEDDSTDMLKLFNDIAEDKIDVDDACQLLGDYYGDK